MRRYYPIYFCNSCKHRLSIKDKYYSHGVCPHCGVNSGGTIVSTNTKSAYRKRSQYSWWQCLLFNKPYYIEVVKNE